VARQGGAVLLAAMYDQLLEILELRPSAVIVHSVPDAVEETYASLTQALLLRQSGQEGT
jgi:hypothetical protein